jgi:hypothetical protein
MTEAARGGGEWRERLNKAGVLRREESYKCACVEVLAVVLIALGNVRFEEETNHRRTPFCGQV